MKRLLSILLALAMMLSSFTIPAMGESESAAPFAISSVEVVNGRAAVVHLSGKMHDDLFNYMGQSPDYFDKWILITGGVAGEPDEKLNGNLVDGAKTYPLDDRQSFEILLNEGYSFVPGREYSIAFDLSTFVAKNTGTEQSMASFVKDVNGQVISTEPVAFSAETIEPASKLAVQGIASSDTSSVDVLFNARVISGMPLRSKAVNTDEEADAQIVVTAADGTEVAVNYVEPVAGSNGREFILYFAQPLQANAEYTLSFPAGLNLTGPLSNVGAMAQVFTTSPDALNYAIESVVLDKKGATESIVITLDRPIEAFLKADGSYETLEETPVVGAVGNHFTRDDVLAMFAFTGVHAADGRELSEALGDVAGYFEDSKTIVLHNDNVFSFAMEDGAAIALKAGAVRNFSTEVNAESQPVAIAAGTNSAGSELYNADAEDYLTLSTSNITYRTFDYYYDQYDDPDSVLDNYTPGHHQPVEGIDPRLQIVSRNDYKQEDIVERSFSTYVVENKYIKATFLPEFGGRLLSLIYKPTGHDLFYLNPVGTPYGMSFNNDQDPTAYPTTSGCPFFSNWLMVWGGVFPTIPNAEHGKFWYLPWDYEIVEEDDRIVIAMEQVDNIDFLTTNPSRFFKDHTNLIWNVSYIVYKDKPYVDMEVSITNPEGNGDQIFEHWTCTTLAPGADTYDGSPTMEIVCPAQILYRDGYGWMASVEELAFPEGTPEDQLPQYVKDNQLNGGLDYENTQGYYMIYDKLSAFRNWNSSGIAYPMDMARLPQADWWGVINQENQEGVLRLGDNSVTPGTKFWLWSYNSSFDTQPYSVKSGSARPYIELWGGASNRFFNSRYIKEGETISWTETFMPTAGLSNVTNASKGGAVEIKFTQDNIPYADVFSTAIGKEMSAVMKVGDEVVAEQTFVADPISKVTLKATDAVSTDTNVTVEVYVGDEMTVSAFAAQGVKPEPEKVAVEAFKINETAKTVKVGEKYNMFGIIDPFCADTSRIDWSSSDPEVATVEPYSYVRPNYEEGRADTTSLMNHRIVTGKSAGTAVITAVVNDPVSGQIFTATCEVTVEP